MKIGIFAIIQPITKNLRSPFPIAVNGSRVGIEQQLRKVKAVSLFRSIRSVSADAVELTRFDARHKALPDAIGVIMERDAFGFSISIALIKKADLNSRRTLGKHGEIDAA
jgi:hypothetical protein